MEINYLIFIQIWKKIGLDIKIDYECLYNHEKETINDLKYNLLFGNLILKEDIEKNIKMLQDLKKELENENATKIIKLLEEEKEKIYKNNFDDEELKIFKKYNTNKMKNNKKIKIKLNELFKNNKTIIKLSPLLSTKYNEIVNKEEKLISKENQSNWYMKLTYGEKIFKRNTNVDYKSNINKMNIIEIQNLLKMFKNYNIKNIELYSCLSFNLKSKLIVENELKNKNNNNNEKIKINFKD